MDMIVGTMIDLDNPVLKLCKEGMQAKVVGDAVVGWTTVDLKEDIGVS